ncbi:signal recognition particle-docking protein FtsY [Spiroplasma sabaudiense Ar-1343]|uniref:Signal recognition particle receptor FtsY n=1 Tax=Spiroplasma sabaudiense Ar-1343 TaxID=1276257 RepID=W6AA34_9MOLU|nr:signal recognition particle-docking protein FtsY [Spiroplasma sabaudiense]AHI54048.1 signal recognition particle-docking protein FtsY [Spiroplasma sabaudiense Ar-1343]
MGFWQNLKAKREEKRKDKIKIKEIKSSLSFSKEIKKLSKKYKEADDDFFEELENVLISTDMGMAMVVKISNAVQKKVKRKSTFQEIKEILIEELYDSYADSGKFKTELNFVPNRLNIFMMVGVNGTGKTTSLAKLANFYAKQGYKVLVAAADTFRAGAVEQLQEWVDTRLSGVELIRGKKMNQDPASVVFDALEKAETENYDLLLIDTAGRLQNKEYLMRELEKMQSIISRKIKNAPHERLLVIDATTGQNGVSQAKSFSESTNVTGIILTKMDGTSKGGIALAIKDLLNIPVKMIGIGEKLDDIEPFDIEDYIYDLVADFMESSDD